MKTGKYLTNAQYHEAPGISASQLSLLEESPRHLANASMFKRESSAFKFGSLVHKLVLEPDKLDEEFVITPKFDLRTKAGNADKDAHDYANKHLISVSYDDFNKAKRMAENVMKIAGDLFTGGEKEQSYFATDEYVHLVKCRPDCYFPRGGLVVDLKTTSDITEFGMRKSVASYNYAMQAAWYMRTLRLLDMKADTFVFVFVESAPPHMVKCRVLTDDAIDAAMQKIDELMATYFNYQDTGGVDLVKTLESFKEAL